MMTGLRSAWPFVRGQAWALCLLALACAPRSDRKEMLMERARVATSALEGTWVDGLRADGERLFFGRAGCTGCHRIGDRGTHFTGPNLGVDPLCQSDPGALVDRDPVACRPVAERALARRPELRPIEYVVESIMNPDRVVTPTYAPKVMKRLDEPPVKLSDSEILAIAAFVVGGACPKTAKGIAEAREFIEPCRRARDAPAEAMP